MYELRGSIQCQVFGQWFRRRGRLAVYHQKELAAEPDQQAQRKQFSAVSVGQHHVVRVHIKCWVLPRN